MEFNDSTPIVMLTVGQLKEILSAKQNNEDDNAVISFDFTSGKYAYVLKGIRDLYGISHATAQKWKDGILKDAVHQHGRKIILDIERANQLLRER